MEEDQSTRDMEGPDSSGDDLDVLAAAQEEEVEALTSLATANSTLRDARRSNKGYGWHGFLSSTTATSRPQQRETGTEVCPLWRITLGLTTSRRARKDSRKEGICDSICSIQ